MEVSASVGRPERTGQNIVSANNHLLGVKPWDVQDMTNGGQYLGSVKANSAVSRKSLLN